jgi:hypothetical protein
MTARFVVSTQSNIDARHEQKGHDECQEGMALSGDFNVVHATVACVHDFQHQHDCHIKHTVRKDLQIQMQIQRQYGRNVGKVREMRVVSAG